MLNTDTHGVISIEVDGEEVFTTGDIGADNVEEFPFDVVYKNVDTILIKTHAYLLGQRFIYGII